VITTPCPSREQLQALLSGRIPLQRFEELSLHVDECVTCQMLVTSIDGHSDSVELDLRLNSAGMQEIRGASGRQVLERIRHLRTLAGGDASNDSERSATSADDVSSVQLGPYRLLRQLGMGGMGTVFYAWHSLLKRPVALKLMNRDRLSNPEAIRRFEREMEAMGRLSHPNIVTASDADQQDGQYYLVMEYIAGCDLSRLIAASGELSIADACEFIRQAADGLQYAHERGLIHRDLKPANLMVTHDGVVKILDLGLARLQEGNPGSEMTSDGHVLGTPHFMSPEQWGQSASIDIRSDIYSLGCTLFCALTGHAPFQQSGNLSLPTIMRSHLDTPPPDIRKERSEVPETLARIIQQCLAKDPSQRMQEPRQLAKCLTEYSVGAQLGRLVALHEVAESSIGVSEDTKIVSAAGLVTRPSESMASHPPITSMLSMPVPAPATQVAYKDAEESGPHPALTKPVGLRRSLMGLGVALTLVASITVVSLRFRDAPNSQVEISPVNIVDFRLAHYRFDAGQRMQVDLGNVIDQNEQVRKGDEVRISLSLNVAAPVVMLSLNPDGTVQTLLPDSSEVTAASKEISFPIGRDQYFQLDVGGGQQAFVAVALAQTSRDQKEKIAEDVKRHWRRVVQGGVWRFDGRDVSQEFGEELPRGQIKSRSSEAFRDVCRSLIELDHVETVSGLAFSVD